MAREEWQGGARPLGLGLVSSGGLCRAAPAALCLKLSSQHPLLNLLLPGAYGEAAPSLRLLGWRQERREVVPVAGCSWGQGLAGHLLCVCSKFVACRQWGWQGLGCLVERGTVTC